MGYYCRIFTRLHWKCRYRVGVLETASFTKASVLSVTQSRFCRFTRGSNRTDTCSYSRKSVFWESFRDIGCAVCECFAPVPGCDCFGASLRRSLASSSQSSKRSKLHHQYSYGLDRSRVLDNDAFNITASCWQRRQIAFIFTRKHSDSNVSLPDNSGIPGNKETVKKHKSYIRSPLPEKLQTER